MFPEMAIWRRANQFYDSCARRHKPFQRRSQRLPCGLNPLRGLNFRRPVGDSIEENDIRALEMSIVGLGCDFLESHDDEIFDSCKMLDDACNRPGVGLRLEVSLRFRQT